MNPYNNIDWRSVGHHKFAPHNHCIVPYFEDSSPHASFWPDEIVDFYRTNGFRIIAITEHTRLIWPLTEWVDEDAIDPSKGGALVFKGNEINGRYDHDEDSDYDFFDQTALRHHMCLYFSEVRSQDEQGENQKNTKEILEAVQDEGTGLVVMAHPGRYMNAYQTEFYHQYFDNYDSIIGIEIVNASNRYPADVKTWDALLSHYMPQRPIWCFGSSDLHTSTARILQSHVVVLLDDINEEAFKYALKNGQFFTALAYRNEYRNRIPVVRRVYSQSGKMIIESLNATSIKWISDGKIISQKGYVRLSNPEINKYIRAEIRNEYGVIFTQPIGV